MPRLSNTKRGFYQKYQIRRVDGSTKEGQKHEKCHFFTLDIEHDKFAIPAINAYADACEGTHPQLAKDLRQLLVEHVSASGDASAITTPTDTSSGMNTLMLVLIIVCGHKINILVRTNIFIVDIINKALLETKRFGEDLNNWELRDEQGVRLNHMDGATAKSCGLSGNDVLYLDLKPGVGG